MLLILNGLFHAIDNDLQYILAIDVIVDYILIHAIDDDFG